MKVHLKPFVKWAGGKGQLVPEIQRRYPPELGKSIRKYAEPFVGGGAVLFHILENFDLDAVYIGDTNAELIHTYTVIRDNPEDLITLLTEYQAQFIPLSTENRKTYYYEKRKEFNRLKSGSILNIELSALFIFLNKTCFNGLYRVNNRGQYNVPMGSYKAPLICDTENIFHISSALENVIIQCSDFQASEAFIDNHTYAYFDPPYRPLTHTANFTSYTENCFDDEEQKRLALYLHRLSRAGAYITASNSDPHNTNPDDDFFDCLYSSMNIIRIPATRLINSRADARGQINELLICNY